MVNENYRIIKYILSISKHGTDGYYNKHLFQKARWQPSVMNWGHDEFCQKKVNE